MLGSQEKILEPKVNVKLFTVDPYTCNTACKGSFHLRFSGFCPLRGYPPPTPLTENQCEKKEGFFLSGIGGVPPSPSWQKIFVQFFLRGLRMMYLD